MNVQAKIKVWLFYFLFQAVLHFMPKTETMKFLVCLVLVLGVWINKSVGEEQNNEDGEFNLKYNKSYFQFNYSDNLFLKNGIV